MSLPSDAVVTNGPLCHYQVTLPTEREHTDVQKMVRKMILGLQRDRYALSEPTDLFLGMSNDTKTMFDIFSSDRLLFCSINSL